MKRLLLAGFALALLAPALVWAQDSFTGTWKLDPASVHRTGKPLVMSLKDGMYHCNCTPVISVKADGEDHPVSGHENFNTVAIKIVDEHTIQETDKQDGKVVSGGNFTVAADGKTATSEFTQYHDGAATGGAKATFKRTSNGAAGSHAVAGSWQFSQGISASGGISSDTYKVAGNDISYSDESGNAYTAMIDGKAVPLMNHGKQDGTVSVKRLDKQTLRETYQKDGKTTLTSTMSVSADGRTMKTSNHNPKSGRTTSFDSNKQ